MEPPAGKPGKRRTALLAQNWRLGHRLDKVGDFIEAFTEVVSSDELGCVQRTGIA